MFKQGRKREAKGLAVLYFIIGLIILLIILAVIYFALAKLDYSDKLDPETTQRPYVEEQDVQPFVEEQSVEASDNVPEYVMPEDEVDLTTGLEELPEEEETGLAAEPEVNDIIVEEPTEEPTPEPTEEPTPEPTPEPTALPAGLAATPMTQIPDLPAMASENGMIGITQCFVSPADDNKLMYVAGYGYVNEADFDGTKARTWLVVTQVATAQKIGYPLTLKPDVSGLAHADAVCQNATACDFELYLDVSQYQEGIYSLALVVGYMKDGAKDPTYKYYPFSGDVSFTVLNGQVITPITTVSAE